MSDFAEADEKDVRTGVDSAAVLVFLLVCEWVVEKVVKNSGLKDFQMVESKA